MQLRSHGIAGWAAALLLAVVVPAGAQTEAVLDGLFPDGRIHTSLESLAQRVPLAADQDFRVVEVGRDAASSHHVVAIRDREVPHRHDHHDLFVVMLEGHGAMLLGDEERPVGPRSILYIPRGTPHAFRNASDAPAIAYAIYFPPFDAQDRTPLD